MKYFLISIILFISNIFVVFGSDSGCMVGSIFGQQIYVPHFGGTIPNASHLGTYLFPIYQTQFVNNSSSCNSVSINSVTTGYNTYVYCKDGEAKDLIMYNITNNETNLNQTTYGYTECITQNKDCYINNTIIKHGESEIFFASNQSTQGVCLSETRSCNNGVLSGTYYYNTCSIYNNSCGIAHEQFFDTTPTNNLCAIGSNSPSIPLFNTTTNQRSWICSNSQGANTICNAYKTQNQQGVGICQSYSSGMVQLDTSNNYSLCKKGNAINFTETTYGRSRGCTNDYGTSYCTSQKSIVPSGKIIYINNSDGSVTAALTNIQPYGAYVLNNNNASSKQFLANGSFTFQLTFNNSIREVIATVNTIKKYQPSLHDLILNYSTNLCPSNKNISVSLPKQSNILDIQTMVNHCLIPIKKRGNGYTITNINNKIKRGEFIVSMYNLVKTIRPYKNNIYYKHITKTYSGVPKDTNSQQAIKRFLGVNGEKYILHTKTKNTLYFKRNQTISSKEIYNFIVYILNLHDDNDIYFTNLRNNETTTSTMNRKQFSYLIRKLLEQYDKVSIGKNVLYINSIVNNTKTLSIEKQYEYLENVYNSFTYEDATTMENKGLSKWLLLYDISRIINNGVISKKSVITIDINDIIKKINNTQINNTMSIEERRIQLFKETSY